MRNLKTTYYGPSDPGSPKSILRVTYGSNRAEALPNITRRLTQNLDGAVVVETVDIDNADELIVVVTMWPGDEIRVPFVGDVKLPKFLTNHED
jgi:hypothetical protein